MARHNGIRNVLYAACQRAAWSPQLEHTVVPNSNMRPADILIPIGPSTQPIALDVTVINPLSPNIVEHAAKTPDYANSYAEKRKLQKYSKPMEQVNTTFKVLSLESFGRLSATTSAFMSKVSTAISNRFGGTSKSIFKDIERKVMVSLVRSAARSALERVPSRLVF